MASVINTNMASLYAQKNLTGAQSALSTSVERLSSGLRINRAKDDAAGLGISEKLKSQIGSLNQGIRNANDAVSMVQTAEGSLSEVSNILQRMKELAVQGRNESLSDVQRAYIADELTALKKEVNAIAERTTFNGMSLLKNALRTEASAVSSSSLVNGAMLTKGLMVQNIKTDSANVGTYSLSIRTDVPEFVTIDGESVLFAAASNVNEAPVPLVSGAGEKIGEQAKRWIEINEGDIFEGARISVSIKGESGELTYSAVAGQDSTAASITNELVAKIQRDHTGSVSSTAWSGRGEFDGTDDVNLSADTITLTGHGLSTGDTVIYSDQGNTSLTGLTELSTTYYAIRVDENTIKLATSAANATAGTAVNITAVQSGTHAITQTNKLITTGSVDTGSDTITSTSHGFRDGQQVRYYANGGTALAGLTDGAAYYVVNSEANTYQLAVTEGGSAINLTGTGNSYQAFVDLENQILFDQDAALGIADISVRVSTLEASRLAQATRSTVDSPYVDSANIRKITLNDFDVVEGRKFTVKVGNPNTYAEFSTFVGAGATKETVAQDLVDLISAKYAGVSRTSNASAEYNIIEFAASENLGQASISLEISETSSREYDLTLSRVANKYGSTDQARNIEIVGADVDPGRTFTLSVDGKKYSYTVIEDDTASTVAYALAGKLAEDYLSESGVVTQPTITASAQGDSDSFETARVTFSALKAGDAVTVGGLTFQAYSDLTAQEVAAAFANLSASDTAGDSTAEGAYSGTSSANYTTGSVTENSDGTYSVTYTALVSGNASNITSSLSAMTAGDLAVAQVHSDGGAAQETYALTFSGTAVKIGDKVSINDFTYTATAEQTIEDAIDNIVSYFNNGTQGTGGTYTTFTSGVSNYWTAAKTSSTAMTIRGTTGQGNGTSTNNDHTDLNIGVARVAATGTTATPSVSISTGGADATEYYTVQFGASGMLAGDTVTVGGLRFTATSTVTQAQLAAAFSNLYDGATYGAGLEYGFYEGTLRGYESGAVSGGTSLTFTSVSVAEDVQNLTVSAQAAVQGVSVGGDDDNVITLTAQGAKLGTADINLSVKRFSDVGVLTVTADDNTGLGGLSQSVELGTLSSGAVKNVVLDRLGISFGLRNSTANSLSAADFGTNGLIADSLSVVSSNNGEALFQVGAAVRDTVVIDGFKDIRITGASKNDTQAEREVFDNLYTTMTAITGGDVDEATFATLETQVEEAITTVSTFRSYLGAQQNRIDYAIANLQAQSENITEANSRIRDTDYAAETANLTKTQIMQQAATAMLAQANQMPNVILALLK